MPGMLIVVSGSAVEAERLAQPLRDRGWPVETETQEPAEACWRIGTCRPLAVVISLDFDPGAACDLACALSVASVTSSLPIVFTGGGSAARVAAKQVAPDATFVTPGQLPREIKRISMLH